MATENSESPPAKRVNEFRVKAITVTPEMAEQIRQRKLAAALQERREAFLANLPRHLLLAGCFAATLVIGVLIGRFLLP
jgi:hypothetical protein